MSVFNYVFLGSDLVGDSVVADWLQDQGIDLQLGADGQRLLTHSGYLPVTLDGATTGFELSSGPVKDTFGDQPPPGIGDRSTVITLVTHSDLRELKAALLVGAALAACSDGVVFYEDDEETALPQHWIDEARGIEG